MDYSGLMVSEASGELIVRGNHNRDPHGLPLEVKAGDRLPLRGEDKFGVHTTKKVAYRALKGTNNSIDVAGTVAGSDTAAAVTEDVADEGCSTFELPADLQYSGPPCSDLVRSSDESSRARTSEVGNTAVSTTFTADQAVNGVAGTINGQITFFGASFSDREGNITLRVNQNLPKVLSYGIERAKIIPGTDIVGVNEGVSPVAVPVNEDVRSFNDLSGVHHSNNGRSFNGSAASARAVLAGSITGSITDSVHLVSAPNSVPDGPAKDTVSIIGLGSEDFPPLSPLLGSVKGVSGKHKVASKAARETSARHHASTNHTKSRANFQDV